MQILQAKLRSIHSIPNTGWFALSPSTTLVIVPHQDNGIQLLKSIETINPLYDINDRKPFADNPLLETKNGHTKRIHPERRTSAYSIFAAPPALVMELADIDPSLIETDRIEIGRKLDHSRWVSFVEISAATRWKKFENLATPLLSSLPETERLEYQQVEKQYRTNDRIQGEFAEKLTNWFQSIQPTIKDSQQQLYEDCIFAINKAERFYKAKRHVETRLPPYVYLDTEFAISTRYSLKTVKNTSDPIQFLINNHRQYFKGSSIEQAAKIIREKCDEKIQLPAYSISDDTLHILPAENSIPIVNNLVSLILFTRICSMTPPFFLLSVTDGHALSKNTLQQISILEQFSQFIVTSSNISPSLEKIAYTLQLDKL